MSIKMKKKTKQKLIEKIEIPQGINVNLKGRELIMKKGDNETAKTINPKINLRLEGNELTIESEKSSKKEKKIFGSIKAHIRNMIKGLNENFKYKLQASSVHFPMTITFEKDSNELVVKNFLGEKKERRIRIVKGVNVKVNKDIIEVESIDIEKAGRSASDIEKGTKVRNRDRRIFQDGIFIIEKPGRSYLWLRKKQNS